MSVNCEASEDSTISSHSFSTFPSPPPLDGDDTALFFDPIPSRPTNASTKVAQVHPDAKCEHSISDDANPSHPTSSYLASHLSVSDAPHTSLPTNTDLVTCLEARQ